MRRSTNKTTPRFPRIVDARTKSSYVTILTDRVAYLLESLYSPYDLAVAARKKRTNRRRNRTGERNKKPNPSLHAHSNTMAAARNSAHATRNRSFHSIIITIAAAAASTSQTISTLLHIIALANLYRWSYYHLLVHPSHSIPYHRLPYHRLPSLHYTYYNSNSGLQF
jgi:hypothetical protein